MLGGWIVPAVSCRSLAVACRSRPGRASASAEGYRPRTADPGRRLVRSGMGASQTPLCLVVILAVGRLIVPGVSCGSLAGVSIPAGPPPTLKSTCRGPPTRDGGLLWSGEVPQVSAKTVRRV